MELTIENIQLFSATSSVMAFVVLMLWVFCKFMEKHLYCVVASFIVLIAGIFFSRMIDNIGVSALNNHYNVFLSDIFDEFELGGGEVENSVTRVMMSVDERIINANCAVQITDFLDRKTIATLREVGSCYRENNTVKGFDKLKSRFPGI